MKPKIPIEYIKGNKRFLNCQIDLSKRVFIPRIETEFWVGKVIEEIRRSSGINKELKILDGFSGSGCIGISLLKNLKNSFVDFVDIDEKAVEQIKINLELNKIEKNRYHVYRSNLFEKLKEKKPVPNRAGSSGHGYDFIFSNPPYVARDNIKEVDPSVLKYEPKKALFGGKKGLFYIKKLLKSARRYLAENGIIYIEIDPFQVKDIESILKKENYSKFKFFKDQFEKYRWVEVWNI